jgi:DNA-binding NarL/FixJ family response regulator
MHRILVVDNFKPWRELAREIIEAHPELQVIAQAGDGEEAVQLATDLKPDLVVLDINLPKLNGLTAAARIFKVSPATKIVFFSQDNDQDMVNVARSVGASAYVQKLNAVTDLPEAIAVALGAKRCEEFSMQASSVHVLTAALDPN